MNRNGVIFNPLRQILSGSNALYKIILINVIVFVIIGFMEVVFTLFKLPMDIYYKIWNNLSLSAIPSVVIQKPWTIVTYMFMHSGFFHILFNMLLLYWFGKILQDYLKEKKLISTYLLGGFAGAAMYLLAYQFIPYMHESIPGLGMVGASAGVMAIIIATATLLPNNTIYLMFFGGVKLKYIAIIYVLIDVLMMKDGNVGGHFAHLGGAIYGFGSIKLLQKGLNPDRYLTNFIDFVSSIFKPGQKKNPKPKFKVYRSEPSDVKFTETKSVPRTEVNQKEIDVILDKIARSGYESLSEKEKEVLFSASKK